MIGLMELSMSDFLLHLRLDDIQRLLNSGHPSIIIQLLCINTLLGIAFVMGRMRGHPVSRRKSTQAVQWLVIACTFVVVSEQIWLPYAEKTESNMVNQVEHVIRSY